MDHEIIHKDGELILIKNLARAKAIKLMCTECMGFETNPKHCTSIRCPVYPFRGSCNAAKMERKKKLIDMTDQELKRACQKR